MLARVRVTPLLLSVPPIALAHRLKRILSLIASRNSGVGRAWLTNAGRKPWRAGDASQDVDCKILPRIQKMRGIRAIAVPASEAVGA